MNIEQKISRIIKELEEINKTVNQKYNDNRLIELEREMKRREEELNFREKYLKNKMEELNILEQNIVSQEIENREKEILTEFKENKIKTGTPRLDDLLYGGIPVGSNILLYGSYFVGMNIMVNSFIAEGLKKGIPAIWILIDKNKQVIQENMKFVLPTYEEYEKKGLVRYIYLEDMLCKDYDTIEQIISIFNNIKNKNKYYRVAFESLTMYYLNKYNRQILRDIVKIIEKDKSVALYLVHKGMVDDNFITYMESIMDGTIEFKVENLRNFLAVRGVCDVQSRAWIRYTFSKSGVDMGSFLLDKME